VSIPCGTAVYKMKCFHHHLPRRRRACVATIGIFDGIHRGHRYILQEAVSQAGRMGLESLVITFDIAPQQFLQKAKLANAWSVRKPFIGYISDYRQKVFHIASCGIDYLWFLRTSRRLLELSGRDFVAYICRYFAIKKLIVGEDFRFGYAGSCAAGDLKRFSHEFGFLLQIISKRSKNKKVISSSLIRELIHEGKVKELTSFLGRPFALRGCVVEGKRLGGQIGFPTANVSSGDYVAPKQGVYAAYVVVKKKLFLAAVFVNKKKIKGPVTIEAHLIGINKNILGEIITIIFLEYIRRPLFFRSLTSLGYAIQKDLAHIAAKYSTAKASRTQLLVL